jgi:hypothetical protein
MKGHYIASMVRKQGYLMVDFTDSDCVIYYTASIVHAFCKYGADIAASHTPYQWSSLPVVE